MKYFILLVSHQYITGLNYAQTLIKISSWPQLFSIYLKQKYNVNYKWFFFYKMYDKSVKINKLWNNFLKFKFYC